MSNKSPMFSFVVPVYGTEAFLPRCIDSILAQTSDDYELVVVNDGSPGDCDEIIARYGNRIRYFKHDKNRSLLQARLTGVEQAYGEYVIPVDSDDFVSEGLVSALADEICRAEQPDVVVYQAGNYDGERSRLGWKNHPSAQISGREAVEEIVSGRTCWNIWSKCIRTDLYRTISSELELAPDFYLNVAEDLCQCIPILLAAESVSYIEFLGYWYFLNPDSLTKINGASSRALNRIEEESRSLQIVIAYAKRHRIADELVRRIRNLAQMMIGWGLVANNSLSDWEWSRLVNAYSRIYGLKDLFSAFVMVTPHSILRWHPDPCLFKKRDSRLVHNIVVLCQHYAHGGAERANWLWMKEMCEQGKQVFWLYDEANDLECSQIGKPVGLVASSLPTQDVTNRIRLLSAYLEDHEIDTVVLVDHWRDFVFYDLLAAKCAGCRVVIAEHSSFLFPLDSFEPAHYLMRNQFYPLADVVTVLSPVNVEWFKNAGITNVVYMPNLLTFSSGAWNSERQCKSAPAKMVELLWVGRLCTRKKPEAAIEALQILMEEHPNRMFHLTLLGCYVCDQVKERVERCLSAWRLGAFVSIPGEVSDVAPYYQKASVLLVTSRIEGAPMVITEAKSYGVPTVMFALPYVAGTEESDGVISVAQGHARDLAEAVYDLVSDSERYARFSRAAIQSIGNVREDVLSRWKAVFKFLESDEERISTDTGKATDSSRLLRLFFDGVASVAEALVEVKGRTARENYARAVHDATRVEFARMSNTPEYLIGSIITWPFRMTVGVCVCLRQNGLAYTVRRIPLKFYNIFNRVKGAFGIAK